MKKGLNAVLARTLTTRSMLKVSKTRVVWSIVGKKRVGRLSRGKIERNRVVVKGR